MGYIERLTQVGWSVFADDESVELCRVDAFGRDIDHAVATVDESGSLCGRVDCQFYPSLRAAVAAITGLD